MLLVRPICGSICSRPAHSRPCARIFGVISTHGWEFTKNSRISTPRKRNLPKQTSCRVEIWRQALAASRAADAHPDTAKLMLPARSEEHTSELQSRPHLVCRLLLEKKKK